MKSTLLFSLFLSFSFLCSAQTNTISGVVYDTEKNVLADANVIVKNTTTGKITDQKGQFTLDVKPTAILEISYLGFKTQEVIVGKQKEVQIILEEDFDKLDTVTVIAYSSHSICNTTSCELWAHILCGLSEEEVVHKDDISEKSRITTLFPNPSTNGLFQLQLDKTYTTITIEVFNMNGQLIQTSSHSKLSKIPQIDVSKQPKGIYLIRTIADGKLLETKKAIRS